MKFDVASKLENPTADMAGSAFCMPSWVYSDHPGRLLINRTPCLPEIHPHRRNEGWKSPTITRIAASARVPIQAEHRPNETFTSVSRRGDSPRSVEPQSEVKLFSSIGHADMPLVSMKEWNLTDRHLFLLSVIACVTGGAVTALFIAAIPTLLAFKRAAESLEKLLDTTREELPGTMAAIRLSGMEISDLTMELSELGQEISSGVRSSARAVRAAQDGLRRVSSIASMGARSSPSRVNEASNSCSSKESP